MKQIYTPKRTLSALFLLMLSSLTWASDFKVDGIYYNINEDEVSVSVVAEMESYYNDENKPSGDIAIPSTVYYGGVVYSVTSIGNNAFNDCSALTSISIPEGVTSIGNRAFYHCISLTSISIPESVTSIPYYAFYGCYSLTSISIPESVTSIGTSAFEDCPLTSISIPKSVTSIKHYAFDGCPLTSVFCHANYIPELGEDVFGTLPSEATLYVPASALEDYKAADQWKDFGTILPLKFQVDGIYYSINEDKVSVSVVAEMESYYNDENKPSGDIVIPSTVSYGGVVYSVTSIGNNAFNDCSALTSISIPEGVTSIGEYAFWGCLSITSISIPEGVTSIGNRAFYHCTSLTSISIPESVTSIPYYAFYGCYSLTSISIPESVTSIGTSAFEDCPLTSISIPKSVTSIKHYAFYGCPLTSVTCHAQYIPELGEDAFGTVPSEATLYVPASALEDYKAAEQWKDFSKILPLENIPTSISSMKADDSNAPYYTLDGIRVENPTKKGIYIRNGKKVVVK